MIPPPAHRSSLSSNSTIPSKSSHTSFSLPSLKKPDERPDKIVHPLSMPPAVLGGSLLGPQSPRVPTKRKRDSEPRSVNNSQLHEARERVEQKRAKIAARVPSGVASTSPTPATVTSLAELYAQMRRDSGVSRQQDASRKHPTTVSGDGRVLDRRPQNPLRGHSSASSPDPIAMSEDDQEIVVLKQTQPQHPQVRPRFEPVTRVGPPAHLNLKSLSKAKPKTSPPKSVSANGIDGLLDAIRKSRPSFAVVVPSPPKRPTHKPVRVEQDTPVSDATHSKDRTPAEKAAPHRVEKLKEITNGKAPEPLAVHTTPPLPVRPVQPAKTLQDLVSEYGLSRSRNGISLSKALTARDIDILLGAVPLSFDFSLSHHHPAIHDNDESEMGDEESPLWWYHPIFEARAKADIRRTLGALLPPDPAQDPPPPGGGADGWRAEVRPRQSRARMWAERLEDAFGPGPLNRGMGRKPRRVARPAGVVRRPSPDSRHSQNGASRPGGAVVIANSYGSTHGSLEPPSQRRSPEEAHTAGADIRPAADTVMAEAANIGESKAAAWTAALLPLVKGKMKMNEAKMAQTNDALGEVERADKRGSIASEVLKESALADTVRRLGELEGVPLGDVHGLRRRARTLAKRWRETFGDDVVDLQRGILLHVS